MTVRRLGPPNRKEGDYQETPVEDVDAMGLLKSILKELRILNLNMAMATDNYLTPEDLE